MPRRLHLPALLAAALLLGGAACRESTGAVGPRFVSVAVQGERSVADVRARQRRWEALGLRDYDYDFAASCFCLPAYTQPAVVHVRGGRVASVTPNGPHPAAPLEHYPTIDELFARAIAALEAGQPVEGEFDRDFGYPTSLTIGTLANDAGVAYTIAEVRRN
jgi:hypothetical protein